jgi:hypothetical protein
MPENRNLHIQSRGTSKLTQVKPVYTHDLQFYNYPNIKFYWDALNKKQLLCTPGNGSRRGRTPSSSGAPFFLTTLFAEQ